MPIRKYWLAKPVHDSLDEGWCVLWLDRLTGRPPSTEARVGLADRRRGKERGFGVGVRLPVCRVETLT